MDTIAVGLDAPAVYIEGRTFHRGLALSTQPTLGRVLFTSAGPVMVSGCAFGGPLNIGAGFGDSIVSCNLFYGVR
jgi:hypothetical protein